MSAPERIITDCGGVRVPDEHEDMAIWEGWEPATEYIRADLVEAAALALPEVAALVEAAYREGWSDGVSDRDHVRFSDPDVEWSESIARAALQAVEAKR
jgi:hypothetical protein